MLARPKPGELPFRCDQRAAKGGLHELAVVVDADVGGRKVLERRALGVKGDYVEGEQGVRRFGLGEAEQGKLSRGRCGSA